MDDGLGLLVTTRPHGKTPVQLLRQFFHNRFSWNNLWRLAARNGRTRMLQWLYDNSPEKEEFFGEVLSAAIEGGHVDAFKFLAKFPYVLHVSMNMLVSS